MMPAAFGYVSVPPHLDSGAAEEAITGLARDLAALAVREGYALAGVFADRRGLGENGLYRLLEAVRRGEAVAVLVPDMDHLRHTGCLTGTDVRTAARYLRARLVTLAPATEEAPPHPRSAPAEDRYLRSAMTAKAARL